MDEFLFNARKICDVRVIDYNHADKIYDNSIFTRILSTSLRRLCRFSANSREALLVNTNLAMQQLDESGVSPYRTFDSISRFCELFVKGEGDDYAPRISTHRVSEKTDIILIEPPCGSNTAIICSEGKYLFVDTGYAYCKDEMNKIVKKSLFPIFDSIEKTFLLRTRTLTTADFFPSLTPFMQGMTLQKCLAMEYENGVGYREQNPLHKPYIQICKILTSYESVNSEKLRLSAKKRRDPNRLCAPARLFSATCILKFFSGRRRTSAGRKCVD
ncbi:MAG: hypothetical protein L6V93_11335 [Clostridiales bacterium]|nr:MAG: hypothetical protein L6V93_11335 [Clostridiales bacterium]